MDAPFLSWRLRHRQHGASRCSREGRPLHRLLLFERLRDEHGFTGGYTIQFNGGGLIGKLLGHSHMKTTARYGHLPRASVHESARRVSESVEACLHRDCPEPSAAH